MSDQIEEVKRKLDVVEVISSYLPLQKSGKNYKALCPFHSEKTPSFMVSPTLQIFKCFGCGEGGDVISFYSKIEGVPFGEALKEMAKRAGVKLLSRKESPQDQQRERIFELNRLAANYFHFLLTEHRIGSNALEFLKRRGLKKETIEEFELGYAPSAWDNLGRYLLKKGYRLTDLLQSGLAVRKDPSTGSGQGRGYYDFFRGRVMFPLRSSLGKMAGFAGRVLEADGPKDA
ncbi:MAG: CHC2 zinc finger domain-containing protein, partial [candidate division WWE3 bacterium]|nr:CHC2 zinc finger domain-containing protein [candidate division WWE3 bacterium]